MSDLGSSSAHLTSSHIQQDTIIPPSTHLAGHIALVWGSLRSARWTGHAVTFAIKAVIDCDKASTDDYAAPVESGAKANYKFQISLSPSAALQAQPDGIQRMEDDRMKLVALLGQPVILDCSGMKVERVQKQLGGMIYLTGTGERVLKSLERIKLLTEPSITNSMPSWFEDSPQTVLSSPIQQRQQQRTAHTEPEPPQSVAGPSRLRPLSSHSIPTIPRPTLDKKSSHSSTNTSSSAKRRLSPSRSSPEKKSRLEEMIQEASRVTAPVYPDPRILTQVRPPQRSTADPPGDPLIRRPWAAEDAPPPTKIESGIDDAEVDMASLQAADVEEDDAVLPTPAQRRQPPQASPDEQGETGEMSLTEVKQTPPGDRVDLRRKTEEAVLAQRRKDWEAAARVNAAKQAAQNMEPQGVGNDLAKLKKPLKVSGLNYSTIADITTGVENIMGIVVDAQPPKEVFTTHDWTLSMVIADPTSHTEGYSSTDLVVTIFRKTAQELPIALARGTAILFRGIKISEWNGKKKGQAFTPGGAMTSTNTWATLPGAKNLKLANANHMKPPVGKVELDRMVGLWKWWLATNGGSAGVGGIHSLGGNEGENRRVSGGFEGGKQGNLTLSEVRDQMFFDGTFKILEIKTNTPPRPRLELYITDGTISPQSTRNFHNLDFALPSSSVFQLAIKDQPPESERDIFVVGNVIKLSNVRAKIYQGGLELFWSELVTEVQARQGNWNSRRCRALDKAEEAVKVIEMRIRSIQPGDVGNQSPTQRHQPLQDISTDQANDKPRLASHLSTIHNDPIEHPITSIAGVISNQTVPNKFRVQARVKSVHPRGLAGSDSLVQQHCMKCLRQYVSFLYATLLSLVTDETKFCRIHCQSCNDIELNRAELRYRFLALLEQGSEILPILIADNEAASFLPPLPPLSSSSNPNDQKKRQQQITEACAKVQDILLGAKLDGERVRPMVDWSLETYEVKMVERGGDTKRIVVPRVFGMKCTM